MEFLPYEILNQIISNVNDPNDIQNLLLANKYINYVTRMSITDIKYNNPPKRKKCRMLNVDFVLKLIKIQNIHVPIYANKKKDLYRLTYLHNIKTINMKINRRLSSLSGSRIGFYHELPESKIKFIIYWMKLFSRTFEDKSIKFLYNLDEYVLIRNDMLYIYAENYLTYQCLFKLINEFNNHTPIKKINMFDFEINSKDHKLIKYKSHKINTIIVNENTLDVSLIFKWLLYTNINTVEVNFDYRKLGKDQLIRLCNCVKNCIELITVKDNKKNVYLDIPFLIKDIKLLLEIFPKVKILSVLLLNSSIASRSTGGSTLSNIDCALFDLDNDYNFEKVTLYIDNNISIDNLSVLTGKNKNKYTIRRV